MVRFAECNRNWFQSTRPHGARLAASAQAHALAQFQSTRPHGARRTSRCQPEASAKFQSTRPHGARPDPRPLRHRASTVSIHAPARGATRPFVTMLGVRGVSIHAPARGATRSATRQRARARVSIHAPARGATTELRDALQAGRVSIHAPARGATAGQASHPRTSAVSIHAPARGATAAASVKAAIEAFQSTRPHGARRGLRWRSSLPWRFNPRARTGRDNRRELEAQMHRMFQSTRPHGARPLRPPPACAPRRVSIHAPARGATALLRPQAHAGPVSIHAPARGATDWGWSDWRCSGRFNPRARTGRDAVRHAGYRAQAKFQSTRPHGARRKHFDGCRCLLEVSIHAPARGATTQAQLRLRAAQVSIHAPARGATITSPCVSTTWPFQSTRPHGARRGTYRAISPL